jgi:hypothetical protein
LIGTDVVETRNRDEQVVRQGGRERIAAYRPSRDELDQSPVRIEARRVERRVSIDVGRIERNRSTETNQRREVQRETQTRVNTRRESTPSRDRQATPERRTRDNEFRMIQPERPAIERAPARRENPTVRPTPRREVTPPRAEPGRRGKDH